ncbi:hypothetical protein COU37_02730 [Candidatus Micrarchaeota archaeon CG10_big_fil_rev_8_21_14_0_10_45_29]|nr:MAG: hypothetical protein COU37_02730 [Candidatus Micrarchaeota archaeon CG10_big_fil_rev_8_21_14_0_10_45_29]
MRRVDLLLFVSCFVLLIIIAAALVHKEGEYARERRGDVVHLDFMHANWCGYCINTRADVEAIAKEIPGVSISVWDEALREEDEATGEIYLKFKQEGLFGGFPTLVASGKKGREMLVGKREKQEVKEWVCSKFEKMPKECEG